MEGSGFDIYQFVKEYTPSIVRKLVSLEGGSVWNDFIASHPDCPEQYSDKIRTIFPSIIFVAYIMSLLLEQQQYKELPLRKSTITDESAFSLEWHKYCDANISHAETNFPDYLRFPVIGHHLEATTYVHKNAPELLNLPKNYWLELREDVARLYLKGLALGIVESKYRT